MNRRDLVINAVLLALILAVTYLVVTLRPTQMVPSSIRLAGIRPEAPPVGPETAVGPRTAIVPMTRYASIARIDVFKTIKKTPPPPPPTPTVPPPPPRIQDALVSLAVQFIDPPTVTLVDPKTNQVIEWKVGQTRRLDVKGRPLDVKLERIDDSFNALFTATGGQQLTFGYFEGTWK